MVRHPVMLRAWWHDHNAGPSWAAAITVVVLCTVFAAVLVPAWGAGPELPVWALAPGTVAMLMAPVALSQLATFDRLHGGGRVHAGARAAWALLTAGACAAVCVPLGVVISQPAVVPIAAVLVLVTFALSVGAGLAASLLGATTDVLAFTYASKITWFDVAAWLRDAVPGVQWLALLIGLASVALYAVRGPRGRQLG